MTREFSPEERIQINQLKLAAHKALCEASHLHFSRYFFKLRHGLSFRLNWHHILICNAVEEVFAGTAKNIIINVPPGSSKTELVVINLIARGLALNPRCRFLHLSYADDLASLNSSAAKDLVMSEEYQRFWPLRIRSDSRSKKRWNVEVESKSAGGVYATALGGQITGFRAGHMQSGFQGAIIIDDPLKVDDAYSKAARNNANRKLVSTVKSRKANPDTPIVVVMQRLSSEDPTGFIEAGNVPGDWKYVKIPALIDTPEFTESLPQNVRDMMTTEPKDEKGRFSYWPYKEPLHDMLALEQKDKYVFNGQYQQRPSALGGSLVQGAWFIRYVVLPQLEYRIITADTAQKTTERNDYSVFEHWGLGKDGKAYLIDVLRGKWEAPDLRRNAREFWNKCKAFDSFNTGRLRKMYIEDKSSGTGLVQELSKPTPDDRANGAPTILVEPIERNRDKLTEWMDAIPHIESGYVCVPHDAPWLSDYIGEMEMLTAEMTHAHDDQMDPTADAVDILLATKNKLHTWRRLAEGL